MASFNCMLATNAVMDSLAQLEAVHVALATLNYDEIINIPEGTIAASVTANNTLTLKRYIGGAWVTAPIDQAANAVSANTAEYAELAGRADTAGFSSRAMEAETCEGIAEESVMLIRWGGTGGKTVEEARTNLGISSTAETQAMCEQTKDDLRAIVRRAYFGANAPTIEIGAVQAVDYGEEPRVANSGDERHAVLDFWLPRGKDAELPTISVGETVVLGAGQRPEVRNIGSGGDVVLQFGIPPTLTKQVQKMPEVVAPPRLEPGQLIIAGRLDPLPIYSASLLYGVPIVNFYVAIGGGQDVQILCAEPEADDGYMAQIDLAKWAHLIDGQNCIELDIFAVDALGNESRSVHEKVKVVVEIFPSGGEDGSL